MESVSAWLDVAKSANPVDLLLAFVVLLGALTGWHRGFIAGSLQLLTLAGSLVLAFLGYRYPAAWLQAHAPMPSLGAWLLPASFLATFIAARLVLGAISAWVSRAVPRPLAIHRANRTLGLLPGCVNGLIDATFVAVLLLIVPVTGGLTKVVQDSALASALSAPAEWLEARLEPIFDAPLRRTLQTLVVREPHSEVKLPFRVADPQPRADLEARMLQMVNEEREHRGLQPLQGDDQLTAVARAHSRDMFARGYFSHMTPDGKDPFDRLREARVRYLTAGENLALAHSLAGAHRGLMNSPDHRANLLRRQFGRVGIAVLDGGVHGLMVTQEFRN